MIKTYNNFINESYDLKNFNRHESIRKYSNILKEKINDHFVKPTGDNPYEEEFDIDDLPLTFQNLLKNFVYNVDLEEWNNQEEVLENLLHIIDYYILDDGEIDVIDGELRLKSNNDINGTSHLGGCLWLLEDLGEEIPCVVYKGDMNGLTVMEETNSFIDAVMALKRILEENGVNENITDYYYKDGSVISIIPKY